MDKDIDKLLQTILVNYQSALQSISQPNTDKHRLLNDSLLVQTRTSNIIQAVEQILGMIGNLKQDILLNDTEQINELMLRRKHELQHQNQHKIKVLREFCDELGEIYDEMQELL